MPVCTGNDMMAELAAKDAALLARIEQEAAATPNGKGLLWKIETEGSAPSYLFGTMHMTDPRVTALTPKAQQAYDAAGTVVIETTEVLDEAKMMASLAREPDLMMFTDGTTLPSLLSPEDAKAMEAGLAARGIPLTSVLKMKPWMLSALLALAGLRNGAQGGRRAGARRQARARTPRRPARSCKGWKPSPTSCTPWLRCRWSSISRGWSKR